MLWHIGGSRSSIEAPHEKVCLLKLLETKLSTFDHPVDHLSLSSEVKMQATFSGGKEKDSAMSVSIKVGLGRPLAPHVARTHARTSGCAGPSEASKAHRASGDS